jgi:hypothetical protein
MNGHIAKRGGEVVVLLDEPTSLADGTRATRRQRSVETWKNAQE